MIGRRYTGGGARANLHGPRIRLAALAPNQVRGSRRHRGYRVEASAAVLRAMKPVVVAAGVSIGCVDEMGARCENALSANARRRSSCSLAHIDFGAKLGGLALRLRKRRAIDVGGFLIRLKSAKTISQQQSPVVDLQGFRT